MEVAAGASLVGGVGGTKRRTSSSSAPATISITHAHAQQPATTTAIIRPATTNKNSNSDDKPQQKNTLICSSSSAPPSLSPGGGMVNLAPCPETSQSSNWETPPSSSGSQGEAAATATEDSGGARGGEEEEEEDHQGKVEAANNNTSSAVRQEAKSGGDHDDSNNVADAAIIITTADDENDNSKDNSNVQQQTNQKKNKQQEEEEQPAMQQRAYDDEEDEIEPNHLPPPKQAASAAAPPPPPPPSHTASTNKPPLPQPPPPPPQSSSKQQQQQDDDNDDPKKETAKDDKKTDAAADSSVAAPVADRELGATHSNAPYVSPEERRRRARLLADRKDRYIRQGTMLRRLTAAASHQHLQEVELAPSTASSFRAHLPNLTTSQLARYESSTIAAVRVIVAFLADALRSSTEATKTPTPTMGSHYIATRSISGGDSSSSRSAIAHMQEVVDFDPSAAAATAQATMNRLLARDRREQVLPFKRRLAVAVVNLRPRSRFMTPSSKKSDDKGTKMKKAASDDNLSASSLLEPGTAIDVTFGGGIVLQALTLKSGSDDSDEGDEGGEGEGEGDDDVEIVVTLPTLRVVVGADGTLRDAKARWVGKCLLHTRTRASSLVATNNDTVSTTRQQELVQVADLSFADDVGGFTHIEGTLDAVITAPPPPPASSAKAKENDEDDDTPPPSVTASRRIGTFSGSYDDTVHYVPCTAPHARGLGVGAILRQQAAGTTAPSPPSPVVCFDASLNGPPGGTTVLGHVNLEGIGPMEMPALWACVHDSIVALAARGTAQGEALDDDDDWIMMPTPDNSETASSTVAATTREDEATSTSVSSSSDHRYARLARALGGLSFDNAFRSRRRQRDGGAKQHRRDEEVSSGNRADGDGGLFRNFFGNRKSRTSTTTAAAATTSADDSPPSTASKSEGSSGVHDDVFTHMPPNLVRTKLRVTKRDDVDDDTSSSSSSKQQHMHHLCYQLSYVVTDAAAAAE
ncbi:hypothetical protein NFJ02_34g85630 [Pycnococcus provasolii]|mmetsp:Transcript_6461/g.16859  ORF Transcript_6461/g.16859 Transcript_6461/m.16859 type:complete len:977 (+) Transcript_6461:197-3127(+)